MLTLPMLQKLWPHGDSKIPGLVEGIAKSAPAVFLKYGLDSELTVSHAMAQFSHECGAGTEVVENLNYRAAQLLHQWPSHFTTAQAVAMQHQPRLIADQAYGGRMGNAKPPSDDGWNYRGRGAAQTTGRIGYAALAKATGMDLLNHPDLVTAPDTFLECGVADFVICGCLPFAKRDDLFSVTQHLNGGQIGAAQRKAWLVLWKQTLNLGGSGDDNTPSTAMLQDTKWVQHALNLLGEHPPLAEDGAHGPLTFAAVKNFQTAYKLHIDGLVGSETIAKLTELVNAQEGA